MLSAILEEIGGSKELPRRSGYDKYTWYGAIESTILKMSLFRFGLSRAADRTSERSDDVQPTDGDKEVEESQTGENTLGTATSKERYEEKRKMLRRGFRRDWMKEYTWLKYNEEEGKMHCRVSREFPNIADKGSSLVNGNNSFSCGQYQRP